MFGKLLAVRRQSCLFVFRVYTINVFFFLFFEINILISTRNISSTFKSINSMKKQIISLSAITVFAVASLISCQKASISPKAENSPTQISQSKSVLIANASLMAYSDKKNCWKGYGDCALAVTSLQYSGEENMLPVSMQLTSDNNQLIINNSIYKLNEDGNHLIFDSDYTLETNIVNELGKNNIVIKKGTYQTTFNDNTNGQTIVEVIAN